MSIPAAGSSANVTNIQPSTAPAQNARAADGDYKTPGAGHSKVKDGDGDYKPNTASVASAQAMSSSAVQAGISSLKLGG